MEWLKADAVQTLSLVYFLPRADSQYHRRHTDFLRQKQRQSGAVVFGGGGGVAANDSGLGRLRHLNGLGGGGIGGIGAVGGGIGGGMVTFEPLVRTESATVADQSSSPGR